MTARGIRVVCECSSVTYFKPSREKLICRWCGKTIYLDDKVKFKEKLMQELRKKGVELK